MRVELLDNQDEGSVTVIVYGADKPAMDVVMAALETSWAETASFDFPLKLREAETLRSNGHARYTWQAVQGRPFIGEHRGLMPKRWQLLVRFADKAEAMRFKLMYHEVDDSKVT